MFLFSSLFLKISYQYICREDEGQTNTLRKTEKRSIDEVLSTSTSANRSRTFKSPIVTQLPPPVPTGNLENSNKRRATRRTTIRLLQDNQNGKETDEKNFIFIYFGFISSATIGGNPN